MEPVRHHRLLYPSFNLLGQFPGMGPVLVRAMVDIDRVLRGLRVGVGFFEDRLVLGMVGKVRIRMDLVVVPDLLVLAPFVLALVRLGKVAGGFFRMGVLMFAVNVHGK